MFNYKKMKCMCCKNEMLIDDVDKDFEGKYDVYHECRDCEISCREEVRFGQRFREIWVDRNGELLSVVKYNIRR